MRRLGIATALTLVTLIGAIGCKTAEETPPDSAVPVAPAESVRARMDLFATMLKADDRAAARSFYASDARMWFDEKTGEGTPVGESPWQEWDIELQATHEVTECRIERDTVIVVSHEVNDFARLLDFPGWRAQMTYWFNGRGEVIAILYVPLEVTPTLGACMKPAVAWLRKHRAKELEAVYPEDRIVPSRENAKKWRKMLEEWRDSTGRDQ